MIVLNNKYNNKKFFENVAVLDAEICCCTKKISRHVFFRLEKKNVGQKLYAYIFWEKRVIL